MTDEQLLERLPQDDRDFLNSLPIEERHAALTRISTALKANTEQPTANAITDADHNAAQAAQAAGYTITPERIAERRRAMENDRRILGGN